LKPSQVKMMSENYNSRNDSVDFWANNSYASNDII
jgi:hypothetical protein